MRKILIMLTVVVLCISLAGCKTVKYDDYPKIDQPMISDKISNDTDIIDVNTDEEDVLFNGIVIDVNENRVLVKPDPETPEANSSDQIEVNLPDNHEDIKVGNAVSITYSGDIAETYPAQISDVKSIEVTGNNLLEQYVNLASKVYEEDSALNGESIVIDFTNVEKLADNEKEALMAILSYKYDIPCEEGTMENLRAEGRVDEHNSLTDCVLFQIDVDNITETSFRVRVEKYRGPLGAYGYSIDFVLKDGKWEYDEDALIAFAA